MSNDLHKPTPQALDLEEAVLGAAMLETTGSRILVDLASAEDFFFEPHRLIFEAILVLHNESKPVDMRTVVDQLRRSGKLDDAGGAFAIANLTSKVSSAANIEYHLRILHEFAMKRSVIAVGMKMIQKAYEDNTDAFLMMDELKKSIDEIDARTSKGVMATVIKDHMVELTNTISERTGKNVSEITGVPSGFYNVDKITQGWQDSDLIILAGRPGMAKTTLGLALAKNAAITFNMPVAIFSLEMSRQQLVMKLVASETSIDFKVIRGQPFDNSTMDRYMQSSAKLAAAPIYIDDTPALSIVELRSRCRRLKAEKKIRMVVVDYLQLMRGDQSYKNRENEIASISRGLKLIAKELNIPVIAISQLSRSVETRGGLKRPILSDLRESGAIEQDADAVVFLWRPEYYGIKTNHDGELYAPGYTEIFWAKHRNGALEETVLRFVGSISQFTEFDRGERFVPKIINQQGGTINATFTVVPPDRELPPGDKMVNPMAPDEDTPF